jgi:hypothetical protein
MHYTYDYLSLYNNNLVDLILSDSIRMAVLITGNLSL